MELIIEYDFESSDGVVRKRIEAVDRDEFDLLMEIIEESPKHTLISPLPKRKRKRKEKA